LQFVRVIAVAMSSECGGAISDCRCRRDQDSLREHSELEFYMRKLAKNGVKLGAGLACRGCGEGGPYDGISVSMILCEFVKRKFAMCECRDPQLGASFEGRESWSVAG
jgi:hypothetical protein